MKHNDYALLVMRISSLKWIYKKKNNLFVHRFVNINCFVDNKKKLYGENM